MRVSEMDNGDFKILITRDEAEELVQDAMFDDSSTLAVTSRLRDSLQSEMDLVDVEDDWEDDEDDDEEIEGLDERITGEEIEGID